MYELQSSVFYKEKLFSITNPKIKKTRRSLRLYNFSVLHNTERKQNKILHQNDKEKQMLKNHMTQTYLDSPTGTQ